MNIEGEKTGRLNLSGLFLCGFQGRKHIKK
jgi:hypothetical protein